jgi:ribosomal protein S18 acetylase RimI-like enzyme
MKEETIEIKTIIPEIQDSPEIEFRLFEGESDYVNIRDVFNACKDVDRVEYTMTLENIAHHYQHPQRSNPETDLLFALVDGKAVGFCRVGWYPEEAGDYIYYGLGWVDPDWRRKGIGSAMLEFIKNRSLEMAADHPLENKKYFQCDLNQERTDLADLLKKLGYEEVRWSYEMTRSIADPLPEVSLPEGLSVRPVPEKHYRDLFEAQIDAFRDHWGFVEATEEDYQRFLSDPQFDPTLWQVAWDGDQIAGMVLNFLDKEENKEYQRKRGYTENISVRRPYRRKGLARYLLVTSILMFREMGMEETALGVDVNNPNHALNLYESVGYQVDKKYIIYRKPLVLDLPE